VWRWFAAWFFPVACIGCGHAGRALCARCAPQPEDLCTFALDGVAVRAVGTYGGTLQAAILAMKRGERAYLDAFAPLLAGVVAGDATIVPLPTSARRRRGRGFDQAVELARRVAAARGLAVAEILENRGGAQHGRARFARLAARGRFRLRHGALVPTRAVLLDDVCTTGATLADASAVLRRAGCVVDGALVLAHTPPGRNQRARDTVLA
jgi:predicted amidophosphoribosyltransferase